MRPVLARCSFMSVDVHLSWAISRYGLPAQAGRPGFPTVQMRMWSRKNVTRWCGFRDRAQNRSGAPPSVEAKHTFLIAARVAAGGRAPERTRSRPEARQPCPFTVARAQRAPCPSKPMSSGATFPDLFLLADWGSGSRSTRVGCVNSRRSNEKQHLDAKPSFRTRQRQDRRLSGRRRSGFARA